MFGISEKQFWYIFMCRRGISQQTRNGHTWQCSCKKQNNLKTLSNRYQVVEFVKDPISDLILNAPWRYPGIRGANNSASLTSDAAT